ncbi:hypothetical protein BWK59_06115 [Flavobacterium davisii]|uniref:Uncharacterized protein n=1 Tax=Flavobacterium davisii TaxID=2906077 RepID=A0A246GKZ9_9FLAO|nr:hypothetical protein [Flavobacterium davisii]OWP84284.1 hypothetical protein BWK59_06115 [Flavobacterium davisii]
MNKKNYKKPTLNSLILTLTTIAIIVVIIFLINIYRFYSFSTYSIDLNITNGIGTFIGGIIGPIFSLIGSILIYKTIKIQKKTLKFQISESQFERDINLLIKYIDFIESSVNNLKFKNENGYKAIKTLNNKLNLLDISEIDKWNKNLQCLINIKEQLNEFATSIENSSKIINYILKKYETDNERLNFLKTIIELSTKNIEFFASHFTKNYENYSYDLNSNLINNPIDISELGFIHIRLKKFLNNLNIIHS